MVACKDAPASALRVRRLHANDPEVALVGGWLFAEWGHLKAGATCDAIVASVRERCAGSVVPSVLLAEDGARAVGTLGIVASDLPVRPELSPWISAVFVTPHYRGRGVGRCLVQYAQSHLFAAGYCTVYLFTDTSERMYRHMGWERLETLHYRGQQVTLMCRRAGVQA